MEQKTKEQLLLEKVIASLRDNPDDWETVHSGRSTRVKNNTVQNVAVVPGNKKIGSSLHMLDEALAIGSKGRLELFGAFTQWSKEKANIIANRAKVVRDQTIDEILSINF